MLGEDPGTIQPVKPQVIKQSLRYDCGLHSFIGAALRHAELLESLSGEVDNRRQNASFAGRYFDQLGSSIPCSFCGLPHHALSDCNREKRPCCCYCCEKHDAQKCPNKLDKAPLFAPSVSREKGQLLEKDAYFYMNLSPTSNLKTIVVPVKGGGKGKGKAEGELHAGAAAEGRKEGAKGGRKGKGKAEGELHAGAAAEGRKEGAKGGRKGKGKAEGELHAGAAAEGRKEGAKGGRKGKGKAEGELHAGAAAEGRKEGAKAYSTTHQIQ